MAVMIYLNTLIIFPQIHEKQIRKKGVPGRVK